MHSISQRRPFYRDLTFQVLAGMALGVLVGVLWPNVGANLKPLGDIFIRLIQMVVGLIIFCTVTHGIASVRDMGKVGRIALKAMVYFEVVTSIALVIGLITINVLKPGVGMHVDPAALKHAAVDAGEGSPHGARRRRVPRQSGAEVGGRCVQPRRYPADPAVLGAVCLRPGQSRREGATGTARCRCGVSRPCSGSSAW
jgi:hypothetical protein